MKIVFKKLPLENNIEIIKWTLFDDGNILSGLRDKTIELINELEHVKKEETKKLEEIVTKKYNEYMKDIDKEIERYTNIWNKYNDDYFKELENYLNVKVSFNEITAYIELLPVFPRDITDNSFDIASYLDEEILVKVCSHESLHFYWFSKWMELYPNTKRKELEHPHTIWKYSEMVTDPILNSKTIKDIIKFDNKAYDSFYELMDGKEKTMDKLISIYNENIKIEDKIKKGYTYISSIE